MGSTGRSRRAAALIALAALTVGAGTADAAQLVAIQGSEQQNFGRIALTFDHGVKVTAKVTGGVLVVAFREPVTGQRERLAAEMPAYVAQVRRDPDGAGLRVADLAEAVQPAAQPMLVQEGQRCQPRPQVVGRLVHRTRIPSRSAPETSRGSHCVHRASGCMQGATTCSVHPFCTAVPGEVCHDVDRRPAGPGGRAA